MNGDKHENQTNACLLETGTPGEQVPSAPFDVVPQHASDQSPNDILAHLDRALAATPTNVLMCQPLRRVLVAAAAAEIRTLRAVLAVATSPGKTQPAAVLIAALEMPALTASAGDVPDGGQL